MNLCQLAQSPQCPHGKLRVSVGTCARCSKFVDSGKARTTAAAATVPPQPVPRDQWPTWAKAIAAMKADTDTGVGSTVDRLLGTFGKVYKATLKAMGVPCGCNERRAEWDARYPYTTAA